MDPHGRKEVINTVAQRVRRRSVVSEPCFFYSTAFYTKKLQIYPAHWFYTVYLLCVCVHVCLVLSSTGDNRLCPHVMTGVLKEQFYSLDAGGQMRTLIQWICRICGKQLSNVTRTHPKRVSFTNRNVKTTVVAQEHYDSCFCSCFYVSRCLCCLWPTGFNMLSTQKMLIFVVAARYESQASCFPLLTVFMLS